MVQEAEEGAVALVRDDAEEGLYLLSIQVLRGVALYALFVLHSWYRQRANGSIWLF
jgi:hypothetical protein